MSWKTEKQSGGCAVCDISERTRSSWMHGYGSEDGPLSDSVTDRCRY